MNEFIFDTIDGEVKAIKRTDGEEEFFDCYLDGKYIGEAYSETEEELEDEIQDLL